MKKVAALVAVCLLCCLLPAHASEEAGVCGENLSWTLADGKLTVSGFGDMYWYDMGSAPWYPLRESIRSVAVEEGVTSLSYCSFFYLTEVTEAALPGTLRTIGGMAFYGCRSLPEVTIPAGVSEIGDDAFFGCRSLSAIRVDEENPVFRDEDGVLFSGDRLICYPAARPGKRYEIPAGTVSVGECAFSYAPLEELRLPDTVRSFHPTALGDCYFLRSVETGGGNWAYTARDGVLYSGSMRTLICYPPQKTGEVYRAPASVETVGNRALAYNPYLKRVEFPGQVKELGSMAFVGCSALRRVVFRGDAPEELGFQPCSREVRVFYLPEGKGWREADPDAWNARELSAWTEEVSLLSSRGRLTR